MYSDKNVAELIAVADHDPDAQYLIGMHYFEGTGGVVRDWNKAAEYFCKAAEKGHADAQFYMSLYYSIGLGVPKDAIKSASLCLRAAARDSEGARKILYEADPYLLSIIVERGEKGLLETLSLLKFVKTLDMLDMQKLLKVLDHMIDSEEVNG